MIPAWLGVRRRFQISCVSCVVALSCSGPANDSAATDDSLLVSDKLQVWLTTPDRTQLLTRQSDLVWGTERADRPGIAVDETQELQSIVGFGAAITDASAELIQQRMSTAQREDLLQELFGRTRPDAVGLSFVRLTIGASDFSTTHYSLDDVPAGSRDDSLTHFSLTPNGNDLVNVTKRALAINPRLTVMASPWSAPAWMKNPFTFFGGTLRRDAYPAFAEYLARYIQRMEEEGIPIALLSLQNEPHHEPKDYPGMRLTPPQRAELVKNHVGPLFARRSIKTGILDWDHNWDEPASPLAVLGDSAARPFLRGVAWHCYAGDVAAQSTVHDAFPDKETYFTECSGGAWASDWAENLKWNVRTLIVGATRNWASGVLLWNMALDQGHGPHLGGCSDCRGVVTIDSRTGTVTMNEEFYALAHASRFVRPGAHRIVSSSVAGIESVAFRNADDESKVLIAVNTTSSTSAFAIRSGDRTSQFELPAGAVATIRWR